MTCAVGSGTLVIGNEKCRLAGRRVPRAQVVEITGMDAAPCDAIMDDRAEGSARITHQRGEAFLHRDVIVRAAGAPGIEGIDRRQAGIKECSELRRGGGARSA